MSKSVKSTVAPVTEKTLYVTVNTYNTKGEQIGTRVVDMYHYGTRNWLQNHHWWAMHNACAVETVVATPDEVTEYLTAATAALADKFNTAA